jgi:hypothetical protein
MTEREHQVRKKRPKKSEFVSEGARDAASSRSEPFVTLPKLRSRLIQLSPPGAAVSNSAE